MLALNESTQSRRTLSHLGGCMRSLSVALIVGILSIIVLVLPTAFAQQAPPDLGDVVIEDSLTQPGAIQATTCPTGRSQAIFVGEGLLFKVAGRCTDGNSATSGSSVVKHRVEMVELDPGVVGGEAPVDG